MGISDDKLKIKIAVASYGNPRSVGTWSGIPAHIIKELENRQYDVVSINLQTPTETWYNEWLRRLHWRLSKKWFLSSVEKKYLKNIGLQLDEEVETANPDIVIAIHGDLISYTTFRQPAIIIHDATFATLLNYYSSFTNLAPRSVAAGNNMYKRALQRADAAIFSSEWASNSAIYDYGASPEKVYTIPLGANLKQIPSKEEVCIWQKKRVEHPRCNLLFLGVDWERKGGPFALQFVEELNKLGIETYLTIVGCEPDIPVELKRYVKIIGFLNKNNPLEDEKLRQLLIESHALILPSLAECYGCVFCEANAFGLPALGRDTGGIPEIIKEGVNGLLLKEGESAKEFAKRWLVIWKDKNKYAAILKTSRTEYEERLNYEIFVNTLAIILDRVIKKNCII